MPFLVVLLLLISATLTVKGDEGGSESPMRETSRGTLDGQGQIVPLRSHWVMGSIDTTGAVHSTTPAREGSIVELQLWRPKKVSGKVGGQLHSAYPVPQGWSFAKAYSDTMTPLYAPDELWGRFTEDGTYVLEPHPPPPAGWVRVENPQLQRPPGQTSHG